MPTDTGSSVDGGSRPTLVTLPRGSPRRAPMVVKRGAVGAAALVVAAALGACGDARSLVPTSTEPMVAVTPPPPSSNAVPETPAPVATPTPLPSSETGSAAPTETGAESGADPASEAAAGSTPAPCAAYTPNDALPLQRCDSGSLVLAVQLALQSAGYEVTALDGEFGNQTDAAVRAFQAAEELVVDGVVGNQTWGAIEFPDNVAADANGDGAITPDEVIVD